MQFKNIIGQEEIKKQLIASFKQNKVAHAQLFAGPEGVGKLPMAFAYAQYINCLSPSVDDSCGVCDSCVKFNKLIHPDLHFVYPIVNNKKREAYCADFLPEWREFNLVHHYSNLSLWLDYIKAENAQGMIYTREADEIIKKLSLKIYEGKFKSMIIWCPEKISIEGANRLLKILEEPYNGTLFILVSDNPENIIGTILSRVQRINFKGIPKAVMTPKLIENLHLDVSEAESVAHLARGSYFRALETVRMQEESKMHLELFMQMMRASYQAKIKEIKAIAERVASVGRERQKRFLSYAMDMFREYFISNFKIEDIVYLREAERSFGIKFAPFINERNIIGLLEEFSLAERHIEQNVNAKMVFFDLCLKTTMLLKK